MGLLISVIISFLISLIISILWVRAIDNMKNSHPDYKGEDFLNWDNEKNTL